MTEHGPGVVNHSESLVILWNSVPENKLEFHQDLSNRPPLPANPVLEVLRRID